MTTNTQEQTEGAEPRRLPRAPRPTVRDEEADPTPKFPMRGALNLSVAASNPQTTAGEDFSIFVVIQNPFNVPVKVHAVETHIPVELKDMNQARIRAYTVRHQQEAPETGLLAPIKAWRRRRRSVAEVQTGTAIAVGTESTSEDLGDRLLSKVSIGTLYAEQGAQASAVGMALNFPENPTADELDVVFERLNAYAKGLTPIELQPGDSVVKQFVLRTKSWVLFTPLAHTLQIQVRYAIDGAMHLSTIPYQLHVRARLTAIALGSITGAIVGSLLRSLTTSVPEPAQLLQAVAVAILASVALVAAFARKSNVQPFVSVEDFWGGGVVGFSVGFFGFEQFFSVFGQTS